MEEGSRLEGLEEEKGEEKLEVVVESNDGDEHVKLIQKIANEANSRDEDKNLELMASPSPNRLKNLIGNGKEGSSADHSNSNAPPDQKDDQEEEVDCAKAKVGKVREENERLKTLLVQAMKKYQSLKTHFLDILQQEEASKSKDVDDQEPEVLVSLSLGRNSITREDEPKKEEVIHSSNSSIFFKHKEEVDLIEHDHNLALTLDYCKPKPKGESHDEPGPNITEPVLSLDDCNLDEQETKKEVGEPCPPSTKYSLNKTLRSHEDDEVSQPTLAKKARVSVRARCDAPTINDGCQWRKYGQKIAKGNPCPRAYYRCTIAPSCPVRKQVQRCAEDRSILITTYEGTHNHPLPVAATAMASTTSAAASMLTSASSNSSSLTFQTSSTTTTTSAYLHGLNFSNNISPSDHYNSRSSYLFHSSPNYSSIFSPSVPNNSHPTITLDLTATQPSSLLFSSSTSQSTYINNSSSSTFSTTPRTNFRFYSSEPNHHNNISPQPSFWGTNGYQNHHHHGFHRHKNDMNPIIDRPEQPLSTETIAAATKAIASDPSFRSALAAAITSTIVGTDTGAGSNVLGKNSSSTTPSGNIIGCASSLLNRSSSSSSSRPDQQGSFMLLPASLSLSSPKNKAATSPTEH